jgi:sugar phosphate permease
MTTARAGTARAWTMLGLGVGAQASGTIFASTPAFLIPLLHTHRGLSLAQAGALAATPNIGLVLTLVAWGALTDKVGERWVIVSGLAGVTAAAGAATLVHGYVPLGICFFLGGMASGSTSAASGRVVVGWFPKERRGLAMGVRQMSQPLGVTVAALTIPGIASSSGIAAALILPACVNGIFAVLCAAGIRNPPRPARAAGAAPPANPYRAGDFLWRIHLVSILLVVPQFTLSTFGLVWLTTDLDWSASWAGVLIAASQFVGALGRIAVGVASDRVASRVTPLRWVAVSGVVVMLTLAITAGAGWEVAALAFVVATTVSVADNGLSFTAVAEAAGPAWSGRALGVQNTGQFLAAAAVAPAVGAIAGLVGFPAAFAIVAALPAASIPLVPRSDREAPG